MGVQGLLPMLKSVIDQVNVTKYRGKTVGIDASGWLYKGCYSCAEDVVLGRDTDVYLNFCIQQIKLLEEHNVRPIFVFDGAPLPAKAELNAARLKTRKKWGQKAVDLQKTGQPCAAAFNKSVSVSNKMIMKFIAILRRMNIEFIVAPYEADAQLAYLSKMKLVDAVISEDSDCVPYGCRTILFKWTADGWASELKRRNLGANEDLSFLGWTDDMFVQFCVLCGCDYCPSTPGVGIITAYKFVNDHRDPMQVAAAILKMKKEVVQPNFTKAFVRAILTFRHHLVFDPRDQKVKMLNPLSVSGKLPEVLDNDLEFLGNLRLTDAVAASIAQGLVHPVTHESYAWSETTEVVSSYALDEDPTKSLTSSETSSVLGDPRLHIDGHQFQDTVHNASNSDCLARRKTAVPKSGQSSWRHLDGVLGTSPHIVDFSSPKVSDNFRSLISTSATRQVQQPVSTAEQLKMLGTAPARPRTKRVQNPKNRVREDMHSGFEGEVSCRVDVNEPVSKRRRELHPTNTSQTPASLHDNATSSHTSSKGTGTEKAHGIQSYSSAAMTAFNDQRRDHSPTRFDRLQHGGFNAVAARRAVTAEEKWDRILQESSHESDGDDSDQDGSQTSSRAGRTPSLISSLRSVIAKSIPSFTSHS